jgi:Ala-tRNA(Pro) deacylase
MNPLIGGVALASAAGTVLFHVKRLYRCGPVPKECRQEVIMSIAAKLKQYLDDNKVNYSVLTHPRAFTAQGTAESVHVPGKAMAKSVVIKAGGRFLLAVLPAPNRVDIERLREIVGDKSARIADESEFVSLFLGCEAGAMPPFGNLYGIDVYADQSLAQDEEIFFNACTHEDAIRMKYEDFERLVKPKIANFVFVGRRSAVSID